MDLCLPFLLIAMRDSIFRFKQFSVKNDIAAMKVGTDGVLLGAWCHAGDATRVLDIGTGTGLIALMIAQRNESALIDAIEIDCNACKEAVYNFNNSPWSDRLSVINDDFRAFAHRTDMRYDLIISNPPFFVNGIVPPDNDRMIARHGKMLTYDELLINASQLLSCDGIICIISPYDVETDITAIAKENSLIINKKIYIRPKPTSPIKRILWEISRNGGDCIIDEIIIETEVHHEYTAQYIELTKDFYLKM